MSDDEDNDDNDDNESEEKASCDGDTATEKPLFLVPDKLSLLPWNLHPLFYNAKFQKLWDSIVSSQQIVDKEIRLLDSSTLTDDERSHRIFELFSQDVLQGIVTRRAIATQSQGSAFKKTVSYLEKSLAQLYVAVVNGVFFWYFFLYFLDKKRHHDDKWLYTAFLWLAVEVFLLSTGCVVYTHLLVPLLSYSNIQDINNEVKYIVSLLKNNMMSSLGSDVSSRRVAPSTRSSARDVQLKKTKGPFSLCPSLFVSTRVAARHPQLLVSRLVRKFRSVVPNQPFHSQTDNSLRGYRVNMRFAALINSISVFFVYVVRAVVQLYPDFEFGLVSVLSCQTRLLQHDRIMSVCNNTKVSESE
jgi:hypothetical protein